MIWIQIYTAPKLVSFNLDMLFPLFQDKANFTAQPGLCFSICKMSELA